MYEGGDISRWSWDKTKRGNGFQAQTNDRDRSHADIVAHNENLFPLRSK